MNQVVHFLNLLAVTEEQGGVKRMLGVCAEFERIARVVLDKSDQESPSRRKRRNSKLAENGTIPPAIQQVPPQRSPPQTPRSNNPPTPQNVFAPAFIGSLNSQPFSPHLHGFSPSMSSINLPVDFSSADFPSMMAPSPGMEGFPNGQQQYPNAPLDVGSFQHPFVPQDLWQMPMTLEWDWAQMGDVNGFQTFDPGQDSMNGHDHT